MNKEELDKLLAKGDAFKYTTLEYAKMLKDKNKFNQLKKLEWENFDKFYFKYAHYIDVKDREKEIKIFESSRKFKDLLMAKFNQIKINNAVESEKASKLADLTFSSNLKTFNSIYELISKGLNLKVSKGTIDPLEAKLFEIELDKRKLETDTFIKHKESRFKEVSNLSSKNSGSELPKAITDEKISPEKHVSSADINSTESAATGKEVSQEVFDIAKEILSMFI
uniref:Uncharacterized protein n=1 Tax=Rhynchosporium graminicola TaxID=2792576 RepID=V5W795_9HELO|nr:hypothetical protein [Rhynchosporium commune]AHC02362.1 hypothetical protein [Rhynchosporium commune]